MSNESLNFQVKCNVLLIGKSGAGKSSFANYLFGVDKFTTGSGKPVTQWEENFQRYNLMQNGVEINVYDSVGLEQNASGKWNQKLSEFLSKMQNRSSQTINSANEIMHVLFYVINAASARIESTEIELVYRLYNEYKIPSAFILTNCDLASQAQIDAIENIIKKDKINIDVIKICSISKKKRDGSKTEPFGKENAVKKVLEASYEKVGQELAKAVCVNCKEKFERLKDDIHRKIDNSNISIFNMDNIDSELDSVSSAVSNFCEGSVFDMDEFLPSSYKSYNSFINAFPVECKGKDIFNDTFDTIHTILDDYSTNGLNIERVVEGAFDKLEDGNIFEKIGAVFTIGSKILFIKSTIKEGVDEIFNKAISALNRQIYSL